MVDVIFVGLGKQNSKDHLTAALANSRVNIVAVCDSDKDAAESAGAKLGVPAYTNVADLLKEYKPDAAVVAVPHKYYSEIVGLLLSNKIHVLKEKPMEINLSSAVSLSKLAQDNAAILSVAVQRKHSKVYNLFADYRDKIGDIFSIHGEYTINISDLSEGWRSSFDLSGGGAVIDMGYHLIDLLTWYFGVPDRLSSELGFHNKSNQVYDVEDTAKIQFSYSQGERKILGSILLSRIYPAKDEGLSIYGTEGTIKILSNKIEYYNNDRELVESAYVKSSGNDVRLQLDSFIDDILSGSAAGNHVEHLKNMVFIDAVYKSDRVSKTVLPYKDEAYKGLLQEVK